MAELGLTAPGIRTFQLIPAMGLGICGQMKLHEAECGFDAESMASWLRTLIARHGAFQDALIDALNTNPMDDEEMMADVSKSPD